eukprot:g5255.t1
MSLSSSANLRCRHLNSALAGVIFGCTNQTFDECIEGKIFGLPISHLSYVQNVKPGMLIFLFNYSSREMHGVFRATSKGQLNINPHAWTRRGQKKTMYPAQVEVEIFQKHKPLKEYEFRSAISENYTNGVFFMFELDQLQIGRLCVLFEISMSNKLASSNKPIETEMKHSQIGGRFSKYSRKSGKRSSKDRTVLEADGLICSAVRPRTVAEANGLLTNTTTENSIQGKSVTSSLITPSNNTRVVDVLRKFLEQQDNEKEPIVLDPSSDTLCLFGGIDTEQYFYRMEYLKGGGGGDWIDGTYLPVISFLNGQAVSLDRNLYILGGETEDLIQSSTPVNLLQDGHKLWKTVSCLHNIRSCFAAESFQTGILVAGGQSHSIDLKSCQIYTPDQDRWTPAPNLNSRRSGLGICSAKQVLYVSGGSKDGQVMNSVEMLDPRMSRWLMLPPMEDPRRFHGTVLFQGKLWVLGGETSVRNYSANVEMYDPRNQCWTKQSPLSHPTAHLTAEVVQDQLLAIGGSLCPMESSFHDLERYSILTESWESGSPVGRTGTRAHHASCVLYGVF